MRDKPPPFQTFLDAHRSAVFAFLVATVGRGEADDCFQETLVAALRAYPRLTDGRNLRGWVLKIAQRKAIDHHRARARRALPTERLPEVTSHNAFDGHAEIWETVGALPTKQRVAVAHRFVAGLPYREIGELMGSSEAAARRNVHDGLKRMRKEWTP